MYLHPSISSCCIQNSSFCRKINGYQHLILYQKHLDHFEWNRFSKHSNLLILKFLINIRTIFTKILILIFLTGMVLTLMQYDIFLKWVTGQCIWLNIWLIHFWFNNWRKLFKINNYNRSKQSKLLWTFSIWLS